MTASCDQDDVSSMKAAGGKGRALAMDSPRTLLSVLVRLEDAYGWRLLGILAFAQWVVKGVVWGFTVTAMDFLLRDYAVPGPKMQVYKAIAMLPWAMKPLFGLLSDYFPIMGYRKAPYIIIVTLVAVAAYSTIGLTAFKGLPVKGAVLCLIFGCMQASVVDLLTEARYAEKIRERPESGPDLMTYVWGGITVGNLFATGSVGFIIEHWGSAAVYSIIALPAATMLVPTCLGWLEESPMCAQEAGTVRSRLWEQKELVVLVLLTGTATIALVLVGLLQDSVFVNLAVALVASVIVISAFLVLLRSAPKLDHHRRGKGHTMDKTCKDMLCRGHQRGLFLLLHKRQRAVSRRTALLQDVLRLRPRRLRLRPQPGRHVSLQPLHAALALPRHVHLREHPLVPHPPGIIDGLHPLERRSWLAR
mmetsp:Transcript_148626/g.475915  ORF Transcript_148626/g.475915 Transcript_148626/m.475915 type:complete len:418 (+) Transcript_148626:140-1393(+)